MLLRVGLYGTVPPQQPLKARWSRSPDTGKERQDRGGYDRSVVARL